MVLRAMVPNVETLGYYRMSLRDRGLARFWWSFLGANPQNTASGGFQADTNLNTICSLVPGKMVSVALSSSAILAAN